MANCTITFYQSKITPEMNAFVDDIEQYLHDIVLKTNFNDFQYIRHDLNITIRMNATQVTANWSLMNYARVQNDDEEPFFYFITSFKQVAQTTVEYGLRMDTVNSLGYVQSQNMSPYGFSENTEIMRQHADRFVKPATYDPNVDTTLVRKIDRASEGLVSEKRQISKTMLVDSTESEISVDPLDWYLIYYTFEIGGLSKVKIMLATDVGIVVDDAHNLPCKTIADLDRTDSKIIKIIRLPYCPVKFTKHVVAGDKVYYTFTGFVYPTSGVTAVLPGFLVSNDDSNLKLLNTHLLNISYADDLLILLPGTDAGATILHDPKYESKLYHSDFRTNKLVYDSFSSEIKLEDFVPTYENNGDTTLTIDFKPTNTINSKFAFKWGRLHNHETLDEEDFDNLLLVTRNNEETLLNSDYINYIKNGYNYDKKAQSLQTKQQITNASVNTIATLAGIAFAPATGGLSLTGAIATGANAINQWSVINNTIQQNENAMQAKIAQLASQSISTTGTDDVDLMKWYSSNKLWDIRYDSSDLLKNQMYNALRLTGYAHNTFEKPDVSSRIWYNYLQCTPNIANTTTLNLNTFETFKNDMISRYQQGVTVFHHNKVGDQTFVYDFERKYENWEKWIRDGITNNE